MFGSAPCATNNFIAAKSTEYAARQNGVEPDVSAKPQLRLPHPV
jgi:hypothetical protein